MCFVSFNLLCLALIYLLYLRSFRNGATTENPFPNQRQGLLDKEKLRKLDLTASRMKNDDALFWLQLLLPITDPKITSTDDPRMAFYTEVEKFTSIYAASMGAGGTYGHNLKPMRAAELLQFHAAVIRDGVHGGSDGGLFRRWDSTTSTYDSELAGAISLSHWRQIKRYIKLNNNFTSPKKGEPGYDPAYKFDFILKVLIGRVNALTLKAEDDQCGDEMTWGFMGYGESGSGLVPRTKVKRGYPLVGKR